MRALLQTGRMQKLCAGVMHYSSQCTGHQLGPIGIFEELECTETDFRLDNIDKHSLNHTQCGTHKCFYRSRHDPKIGYVVVPYGQPTTDVHWLLTELYPYATRLAATYHIRHGLVGPPLMMDLSELFAKQLAKGIGEIKGHGHMHQEWSNGFSFRCGKRFWSFLVQRVISVPAKASIMKYYSNEAHYIPKHHAKVFGVLEKFIREQTDETLLRTLQKDLFAATNMLAGEPGLVFDFQMMFLPDTGQLLHIDLDRGREGKQVDNAAQIIREGQQKIGVLLNSLSKKLNQQLVEISKARIMVRNAKIRKKNVQNADLEADMAFFCGA